MQRLETIRDLLNRYGDSFSHAWKMRRRLDAVERLPYETQFLPSVLALQEAPPPAAPRVTMWVLIAVAVLATLWASFGKVDIVATAPGKIIPNERTKTIQSIETSVVRAIHVTDGKYVRAGDVLIELDNISANADSERLINDLVTAQARVAASRAMLNALKSGKRPSIDRDTSSSHSDVWSEVNMLLDGQFAEFTTRIALVESQIAQRAAEREVTLQLLRKLEQTAPIAAQRAENVRRLADQQLVAKDTYLQLEQTRIEQESDFAAQKGKLKEIDAGLLESQNEKNRIIAEVRRINLDAINDGMQKISATEQDLRKANSRTSSLRLTSPVDGTVQQLAVHTLGGVVSQAQPLMMIVPEEDALEIEAFIDNKDIGFVKSEQDAAVKVEAFQYTKYGLIDAKVMSVSHDAINDERRGLIYSTRVKMARANVNVDGVGVNLLPGMSVSVEIKTGRRRIIEYFLNPFLQYSHDSFRER